MFYDNRIRCIYTRRERPINQTGNDIPVIISGNVKMGPEMKENEDEDEDALDVISNI